ncbi:uncharacterized protein Z520_11667 [Fonsecaea multimorphosa CBS 102226]|uniref:Enoyl reductase (ER) domain-containing protein n=1 Tax=Fonsecaea multimorphosa CBS 102226 TaxID=1442371 RepID=A0A0D2K8G2_9EURO|nr:uncharacterized protein Z520_11667 [Fonsecaea multimorphosa CBS 102226]KIX92638.1 hypothetical protein Z520_11667 [Fonsecaea multimorphosa CBS 102226]OAL17861.1 hypothetical protein AYO22_11205 [Fonsecaea multimorphosa]
MASSSSTTSAPALPPTMRAWQFTSTHGGLEKNLFLNNSAPLPVPPHDAAKSLGPDRVLVQVVAAALNPVDYKIAELPVVGRLAIKTPSSPGLDFAGRVVAVGNTPPGHTGPPVPFPAAGPVSDSPTTPAGAASAASGSDVKVGQLVFGRLDSPTQFGTLAEYTVARRAGLAAVPEGVTLQDAAGVATVGLTAYQAIVPNVPTEGGIEGGGGGSSSGGKRPRPSRVFINGGSGGVGVWAIQIAKALGCYVVASCSGRNAELCKSLGADEVLDYTQQDVLGALKKMSTTPDTTSTGVSSSSSPYESSNKFDLVVDNVGNSDALYWQCHHFTTPRAKYVQVGAGISASAALQMVMKMLWPGFLGGGKRKLHVLMVSSDAAQLARIAGWMAQRKVKAVVDEVVPMEDAPRAFEKLKTGHARGKIVVAVSE